MKRSHITKKRGEFLKECLKTTHNITEISKLYCKKYRIKYKDIARRTISKFLEDEGLTNNKVRLEDTKEFKEASKRILNDKKYYIVTWQQNATPVHKEFWGNILAYADYLGAEISVILGRYKNPTSIFTDLKYEFWESDTNGYKDANRHDIHKYLTVLGDMKIRPTLKYPLTGIQGMSQGKSIIVGHPKLHMNTQATLSGYAKKMLFTTGAVTYPNYTDSGTGKISENSHKFGFVIVEMENEEVFYIRQVEADLDGNFIDLIHEVKDGKVTEVDSCLGMVCGDSHFGHLDPKIDEVNDVICERLNVPALVLHDAIDGESCNNHIIKNPIEQYRRFKEDKHLIEKELDLFKGWLNTKLKYNPIIPQANHNNRFDRILSQDWRKDVQNSLFYFKYTTAVMEGKADNGVLPYFIENNFGDAVKCLSHIDSYKIGQYECSQHGDNGSNGAKGSSTSFRNLDIPIILAHTHTPFRADDCFYVGTNTHLNLGYNDKGASSWCQANVIINKNNIAQHIIFVKGKFTTFNFDKKIS